MRENCMSGDNGGSTLVTGSFYPLRSGYFLHIHEEYDFREHTLSVKAYSYNLLDKGKNNIIRADCLAHHQVDYKGHKLAHFPHHVHDEKGRICSFSGRIEDFLTRSFAVLESMKG